MLENLKVFANFYQSPSEIEEETFILFGSFLSATIQQEEMFRDYVYGVWGGNQAEQQ
jgi:hypothetical protein